MLKIGNKKDFTLGVLFSVLGGIFAVASWHQQMGKAGAMGPGYFPFLLSVLLVVLGLCIAGGALREPKQTPSPLGKVAWRAMAAITAASTAFGVLLGGVEALSLPAMGLMPAIVALVCLSRLAEKRASFRETLMLAGVLASGSYVLFIWLLKLPIAAWPSFI